VFLLGLEAKLIAGAVAVAALLGGYAWFVHYERGLGAEKATAAIQAKLQADANAAIAQAQSAESDLAIERAKSHVVYQTITHEVDHVIDRPVYLQDCLDSDGLALVNRALSGVSAIGSASHNASSPEKSPGQN
jgi:hypothetical protein